jgi:hypothetical protein
MFCFSPVLNNISFPAGKFIKPNSVWVGTYAFQDPPLCIGTSFGTFFNFVLPMLFHLFYEGMERHISSSCPLLHPPAYCPLERPGLAFSV